MPLGVSLIIAVLLTAFLGYLIEKLTFKPIRKAPALTPLITSIGISFALQSLALMFFGANIRAVADETIFKGHDFFGAIITNAQIMIILGMIVLMIGLYLYLKFTKIGKAIRAVSDNHDVAAILGINTDKVISTIFVVGSGLAAVAGVLIAYEQNIEPTMGVATGIKAFVAIILGGVGSIPGAVLGGMMIGLAENLGIGLAYRGVLILVSTVILTALGTAYLQKKRFFKGVKLQGEFRHRRNRRCPGVQNTKQIIGALVPSFFISYGIFTVASEAFPFISESSIPSGYKDAIAFVILILVLIIKPGGIFGTKAEEDIRK